MAGKTISVVNTKTYLITLKCKNGDESIVKTEKVKLLPGEVTEVNAEIWEELKKNSAVQKMIAAKSVVVGKTVEEATTELPEGFVPDSDEDEGEDGEEKKSSRKSSRGKKK